MTLSEGIEELEASSSITVHRIYETQNGGPRPPSEAESCEYYELLDKSQIKVHLLLIYISWEGDGVEEDVIIGKAYCCTSSPLYLLLSAIIQFIVVYSS